MILKSQILNVYLKSWFIFIFNWSVYPLISSTKSGALPELEAWHAILYLVTPWQNLPRIGSRLGSICQSLTCYSISCHALAVPAEAWHAIILYLITPLQYLPRPGMLFYILSRLGSICQRTNLQKPKLQKRKSNWNLKNNPGLQNPKLQKPELRKLSKQRHAGEGGVRGTLWICWGGCRFRTWQRGLDKPARQICKTFLAKNFAKII